MGWNPMVVNMKNTWGFDSGLGDDIYHVELYIYFTILNIYGLYKERVSYWNRLKQKYFFKNENLILGGGLNFTIGNFKNWGPNLRSDHFTDYFDLRL